MPLLTSLPHSRNVKITAVEVSVTSYPIIYFILKNAFSVVFPIVTTGAALIFTGAIAGTSIVPTVIAGGLGILGLGSVLDSV